MSKIPKWKEDKLKEISQSTLDEVLDKLYRNNRVLAVRPTGFGKSFMLAGLTSDKDDKGELRFKKCLYVYPTTVIKQDVINTYGPCGKDERAGKLNNTTFISYMKLTNMINDLDRKGKTTVKGLELYEGIVDLSSDGDWTGNDLPKKKYSKHIETYQGKQGLRGWFKQFDLIMLDECHKVGSDGFSRTWSKIESVITGGDVKLVGVTATPYRLDGIDIKEVFGKKNQISELTLSDCIVKLKLLSKFDYVYVIGDRLKYLDSVIEAVNKNRKQNKNTELAPYELDELTDSINRIPPMSTILQESINSTHIGDNNYMKFVVFFRDKEHINNYGSTVREWFTDAFPNMDIDVFNIVTQGSADGLDYEISDTEVLDELDIRDNHIDLIFCIDKLNMGYHVESITGVILLRETTSAVLYNQQIGRCFSVRSMQKPIIFDLIDKCGTDILIEGKSKGKGSKKDLPNILTPECVDIKNYGKDFITLYKSMRKQVYDIDKKKVLFLYNNRQAPISVIHEMTGIDTNKIKDIIKSGGK